MDTMKNIFRNLKELYWKYDKPVHLALVMALAALYFLDVNQYMYRVLIMIGLYAILALSLNIILGLTGMLSMGHAAFYSIGAYASAVMGTRYGMGFFSSAVIGVVFSVVLGMLLGLTTMRLSGSYLAITTMGFAEVVRMVLLSWEDVTNGAFGIQQIPRPSVMGYELTTANGGLYLLVLSFLILSIAFCAAIDNSKLGRTLRAIKNDELATVLMGVSVERYKVTAFAIAGGLAGLAGATFAAMNRYIDPNTFNFDTSMLIVCICILGGMGSIKGQFLGAVLLVAFPEVLRSFALYRFVVYGLILLVMMRFRSQGLLGSLSDRPYRFPKGVTFKHKSSPGGDTV